VSARARPRAHPDELDAVFFALSDPTRRQMLAAILEEGDASAPSLTARLPISRQGVAKHLATLEQAGLLARADSDTREVRYALRREALAPALSWLRETDAAWAGRLDRLKRAVERPAR
jgi:DNA-binding transcriptional ArsR family regulator